MKNDEWKMVNGLSSRSFRTLISSVSGGGLSPFPWFPVIMNPLVTTPFTKLSVCYHGPLLVVTEQLSREINHAVSEA